MRKIAFIGGFDKFDIILYVAIILSQSGSKCLIVDSTDMQKTKYIVPTIIPEGQESERNITTFQGVDIAMGYKLYQELEQDGVFKLDRKTVVDNISGQMILEETDRQHKYDYVFIDLDNIETFNSFNFGDNDLIYLATSFDVYSIRKGLEVIEQIPKNYEIHKILFGKKITKNHLSFLKFLSKDQEIKWGKTIAFPHDNGDWTLLYENQRENRLNLKPFSRAFKKALRTLSSEITVQPKGLVSDSIKYLEKN